MGRNLLVSLLLLILGFKLFAYSCMKAFPSRLDSIGILSHLSWFQVLQLYFLGDHSKNNCSQCLHNVWSFSSSSELPFINCLFTYHSYWKHCVVWVFLPDCLVPLLDLNHFSGELSWDLSYTNVASFSRCSLMLQLVCVFAWSFSCRVILDSVDLSCIFSSRTLYFCFFIRLLSRVDLTRLLPNAHLQPFCIVSQHFMKSIISRSKTVHVLYNLQVNKSDCDSLSRIKEIFLRNLSACIGNTSLNITYMQCTNSLSQRSWGSSSYETVSYQSDRNSAFVISPIFHGNAIW